VKLWRDGDAGIFRLRCGPNYCRFGRKAPSAPALYRCFGFDVVQATTQISCATAGLSSAALRALANSSSAPSRDLQHMELPRIIVVNFQVPFEVGAILGGHPSSDHGCSVLIYFRLQAPSTHTSTASSPGARLLARYLHEGDHPRCEGTYVSGCLKAVGIIEETEALDMPAVLRPIVRRFNGKPVLVERETRRHDEVLSGVVELAVDIRGFNPLARSMLRRLRGQLSHVAVQVGLLIQGCENEELPEQLLGAVRFSGLDLLDGRVVRAGERLLGVGSRGCQPSSLGLPRRLCCCQRRPWTDDCDKGGGGGNYWATLVRRLVSMRL